MSRYIVFTSVILLVLSCGDVDYQDSSSEDILEQLQAIGELELLQNEEMHAILGQLVVTDLENMDTPPDSLGHDTYLSGIDIIPYYFTRDASHTFVIDSAGKFSMKLVNPTTNQVLVDLAPGDTAVKLDIPEGFYELQLHSHLQFGQDTLESQPVFIVPYVTEADTGESLAKTTGNIFDYLWVVFFRHCRNCNLSFFNFSSWNLKGVDFSYSDLNRANFESANLSYSDLSWGSLESANCENTDLSNARLMGTYITGTDLSTANLEGTFFYDADLSNTNFSGKNLRNTTFWLSDLTNCDFRYADLTGANLRQTILIDADLSYANGDNTDFYDATMIRTKFLQSSLKSARFASAEMSDAQFTGANLAYGRFQNANLNKSDLSNTNLSHSMFHEADLTYANLRNANLDSSDIRYTDFSWSNLVLTSFDFTFLIEDIFHYANACSANFCGAIISNSDFTNMVTDSTTQCPP